VASEPTLILLRRGTEKTDILAENEQVSKLNQWILNTSPSIMIRYTKEHLNERQLGRLKTGRLVHKLARVSHQAIGISHMLSSMFKGGQIMLLRKVS
jgi:hypothetical protein